MNDLTPNDLHAKGDEVNLRPSPEPEALEALDNLAAEAARGKTEAVSVVADAEAARLASIEKAKGAKSTPPIEPVKAVEPAVPAPGMDQTPPAKTVEERARESSADAEPDKKLAEVEKASAAPDPFEGIALPPNVKPKSAEAFNALKTAAKEKVAEVAGALTQAQTELRAAREELEKTKALVGKLPPEIERELQDLRNEHAMLDVNNAPEIKKFDTDISSTTDTIYQKLLETGVVDQAAIDKIKELGGPAAIDWEPVMAKLSFNDRRVVEMLLTDIERARIGKDNALKNASSNASEFLSKRQSKEAEQIRNHALSLVKTIPWMSLKEIPDGATPEQKKELESWNASQQLAMEKLNSYLGSHNPQTFAELAVGTVLAYQFKSRLDFSESQLSAAQQSIVALTKECDELKSKIEKIKTAQIPRNRGDAIVVTPPPAKEAILDTPGQEALDSLAKQIRDTRDE